MDADDPEPSVKRDTTIMAVGYNGEIVISIDGENWTSRSSGTSINLLDVAFGNNNFVAVGYLALEASTTGSYNTAVGARVLDACTTGNRNTAVGRSSLSALTTGSISLKCI